MKKIVFLFFATLSLHTQAQNLNRIEAAGLLVAMATVSYHAIKASTINPAETLKYE